MLAWMHLNPTGMEFLLVQFLKSSNGVGISLIKSSGSSLFSGCKLHSLDSFQSGWMESVAEVGVQTGLEFLPTEFKEMSEWLETTPDALQTSTFLSEKP